MTSPKTNNNFKPDSASSATTTGSAKSTIVDPLVAALWGVVPIQAKLYPGDLKGAADPATAGTAAPDTLPASPRIPPPPDKNLLVPRQGFLLYHMDSLRAHFSPYAANIHSLWLSVKDKTGVHAYIPWHVPTHVIMDRVMSRQQLAQAASPLAPGGSTTSNFPHSPTSFDGANNNNNNNNNNRQNGNNNNVNRKNEASSADAVHYEAKHWGSSFLPLVVYVHFTLPPANKKKQRPDLAATPEAMLTLKDTPGITTLHLYRWLKEVYLTRFSDLVGFEAESIEAGVKIRSIGLRILKAARDNDPQLITEVRADVVRRQQNTSASSIVAAAALSDNNNANNSMLLGIGNNNIGATATATNNNNNNSNGGLVAESSGNDEVGSKKSQAYCVVVHTFDGGAGDKPQFKYKVFRVYAGGRTLGRVLPELIPYFEPSRFNQALLQQDGVLPPTHGTIFVQGLQPTMTTPFEILYDMFQSVDMALHIIWRPAAK